MNDQGRRKPFIDIIFNQQDEHVDLQQRGRNEQIGRERIQAHLSSCLHQQQMDNKLLLVGLYFFKFVIIRSIFNDKEQCGEDDAERLNERRASGIIRRERCQSPSLPPPPVSLFEALPLLAPKLQRIKQLQTIFPLGHKWSPLTATCLFWVLRDVEISAIFCLCRPNAGSESRSKPVFRYPPLSRRDTGSYRLRGRLPRKLIGDPPGELRRALCHQ